SRESVTHPDRLKGVIENSGLFLESRILGSDSGGDDNALLERDLKTTLLRLASLIRQSLQQLPTLTTRAEGDRNPPNSPGPSDRPNPPPQSTQQTNTQRLMETSSLLQRLAAHSEGAIAAIQTQQLFSLQAQQQSNEMLFNLEIPLFNGKESEQLGLKIRREGRRHREAAKTIWSVTLKLDNDDYGTIRAVVTLIDREVSTTFWCEQGETRELFTQHMEELRQRINEQGLELGRTQAFTGTPPEPNNPDNAPHPNGILRTQA
ncbi:MAG: flagellar hook-length control protein FliK, partial [Chromatiales bacterium]|nr:flagellar hook-length control protein FliK [Chromatiales bacterium]